MSFPSKLLLTGVLVIGLLLVIEGSRMREMERMISYMEEKYGEAFSPVQPFGGQLGKNLDALELKSEKFKGGGILVRRIYLKEQEVMQDNYLAFLLEREITCRIAAAAEQAFGESSVVYQIPELVFPADFPAKMSAEEFLRNPWSMVKVTIMPAAAEDRPAEKADIFFSILKEKGYIIGGTVLFSSGQRLIFSMGEEGTIRYLEWREREGWGLKDSCLKRK